MLNWANRFNICCFLDNQQYDLPHHSIECLAGVGVIDVFEPTTDFFSSLSSFTENTNDWIFGHFNYDCKNYVEQLSSANFDGIGFPDCFLFVPEVTLQLSGDELVIGVMGENAREIFDQIEKENISQGELPQVNLTPRISKEAYVDTIEHLRHHIRRGDCYEINFCQEFYSEEASVNFIEVFNRLAEVSPNPFCAYYRVDDKFLACASPERYLKKTGSEIISQPIKGTSARDHADKQQDQENKHVLLDSPKDRSENIMIVDLVRNDLSKVCKEGTVKVDELMGIYSFPNVHQMISTVSGILNDDVGIADILHATFPMGSMTGAPKKKVMELIEQYEQTKRGIFSGAVGYISPGKDFDFNVVIRSIMYNETTKYLSYQVGGAITFYSNPETEYEECLLKATAIEQVLSGK
jgi:para-aminobenzoate synthetase component 1